MSLFSQSITHIQSLQSSVWVRTDHAQCFCFCPKIQLGPVTGRRQYPVWSACSLTFVPLSLVSIFGWGTEQDRPFHCHQFYVICIFHPQVGAKTRFFCVISPSPYKFEIFHKDRLFSDGAFKHRICVRLSESFRSLEIGKFNGKFPSRIRFTYPIWACTTLRQTREISQDLKSPLTQMLSSAVLHEPRTDLLEFQRWMRKTLN